MPKIDNIQPSQEDTGSFIDENALANDAAVDDEASLSDALATNPVKMFLIRAFIKTKNHLTSIPMFLCILSMIFITFLIHQHVSSIMGLPNDKFNSYFFFVNCLLSLMIVLSYLRVHNRHVKKKQYWVMFSVTLALIALSIFLDWYMIHDINIETSMFAGYNKVGSSYVSYFPISRQWSLTHMITLIVTAVAIIAAPILQPITRKIHIKIRTK